MVHATESYKEYHESYLSNLEGTTIWDISLLLVTIVCIGFHTLYIRCHVNYHNAVRCFIVDNITFIIPSVLLLTVFNSHVPIIGSIFLTSATTIITCELFFLPNKTPANVKDSTTPFVKHRPFITNFKAVISLLSIICILAVDFTVFPLKYAKTEKYGYSLMDTGVGFFIVANGLTVKAKRIDNIVRKSFIANFPILVLGVIRYASVEKINYQKHTTEYGVHWNFFFTLSIVKFLGSLLIASFPKWTAFVGITLLAGHESMLNTGLGDWVLSDAPRNGLVAANREGLISVMGYLSLYLLAAGLGSSLLCGDEAPTVQRTIGKGSACFVAAASIIASLPFLDDQFPPSRRLCNATFICWMMALCLLVISFSLVWEVLVILIFRRRNIESHQDKSTFVLEAISANNLLFFLVCNLLTGAVNMSMKTLFVPPLYSVIIISSYVIISCGLICVLYVKKWKVKFW